MSTNTDPHRVPQNTNVFRITLVCGHVIKVRIDPFSPDKKYGCTAGLGCGYSLAWTSWTNGALTRTNPKN